jgi:uncharacterized protein YwgA
MATSSNEPIKLESGSDLLITLLYTPGKTAHPAEPIDGITRLQKLMFLLQQNVGPKQLVDEAMAYGYKPYKMGPYANALQRDLNELQAAGIIITERLDYWLPDDGDVVSGSDSDASFQEKRVESYRFYLSELGKRIGDDIWNSIPEKQRQELVTFKKFFNALSLRQLLIFTYEKFPSFTSESVIKSQLGLS